jgi:adenylosuccinate synthase
MTKLDVLDNLREIKVCVAYEIGGKRIEGMPATSAGMEAIRPVYETLPGWSGETRSLTDAGKLPQAAKDYLNFLEQATGVEIGCISTGPERNETIVQPGSKLAKMI